jgi:asparaginyl-tRNA synthetase
MNRTRIKDILDKGAIGQLVTVCGWIRTKRESKGVAFIALSDGSSQDTLQLVISGESHSFEKLKNCNTGAALKVTGGLKESPGKGQSVELDVAEIEVFGDADPSLYPLQKKGHSLEFLRDIGHLRPRTNTFGAVLRVRNILANAIHHFFQSRGFIWIHTPIITSSDCEGAGDLFTVTSLNFEKLAKDSNGEVDFSSDFFDRRAYLTVSGQLEAEFLAMSMGDVYTFGPTFRAENSNTSRHLSEFWMIEPEMAFANLRDDMKLAEYFIQFLCKEVLLNCESEIAFFKRFYKNTSAEELQALYEKSFEHITYTEAVKELKKANADFEFPVQWGLDLQSEHERYLTDKVFKGPVIVTDYPKDIKAFYMRLNDDEKTVAAMDVLVPKIGEIIGGSQREERLHILEKRMSETEIPPDSMDWYLDLRRFGSAPHAGFGLGFERLVQYITGMANIRDVIPCPRTPHNIRF